jgi:hypothetical protein
LLLPEIGLDAARTTISKIVTVQPVQTDNVGVPYGA